MSKQAAWTTRWGDPPLVEEWPLSRLAILAVIVAAAAPVGSFLGLLIGTSVSSLVGLARLVLPPLSIALAYGALHECRPAARSSGRGLVWIALALGYFSLVRITSDLSALWPILRFASYGAFCLSFAHILAFAAESAFAKAAVAFACIALPLFAMLSCGLLHTREQARRYQCQMTLTQWGLDTKGKLNFRPRVIESFQVPWRSTDAPASKPTPETLNAVRQATVRRLVPAE
jgi:hypothetical protein